MGEQTVYKEDTLQEMVHTTKTKITLEQSNTIVSFQSQTPAYLAGPKRDDSGNGTHHVSRMKTHVEFDSMSSDSGLFNEMEASMDMLESVIEHHIEQGLNGFPELQKVLREMLTETVTFFKKCGHWMSTFYQNLCKKVFGDSPNAQAKKATC